MIDEGLLKIVRRPYFQTVQQVPIALRDPNLSVFGPEELQALDGAIEELRGKTATEVSSLSHQWFNWWDLLKAKETIDLAMALFRKPKAIPQEVQRQAAALV